MKQKNVLEQFLQVKRKTTCGKPMKTWWRCKKPLGKLWRQMVLNRVIGEVDWGFFLHNKPNVVSQTSQGGSKLNHIQPCSWFSVQMCYLQYRQSLSELKNGFFQARTHRDIFGIKLTGFLMQSWHFALRVMLKSIQNLAYKYNFFSNGDTW